MAGVTYVPLENELLVELIDRYSINYARIIEHAVGDFLTRTEEEFEIGLKEVHSANENGYMWERLYLPEGTRLMTRYYYKDKTAELQSGKFIYDGRYFSSPSKVCNAMRGGTHNNAWRMLWVKRPIDISFRRAETLRK